MKSFLRIIAVLFVCSLVPSCAQDDMDEINVEVQDERYTTGSGNDGKVEKPGGN
ncbi:MAG: hypothetical protein RIC35_02775 [Marinoscillum sp.]